MSLMHDEVASIFNKADPQGAHLYIYNEDSGQLFVIPMLHSSDTATQISPYYRSHATGLPLCSKL